MARETLTREQIIRAAVELLDAEGVDGLSMRRLGSRLGAGATSLYWHVANKADLVVQVADEVCAEVGLLDPGEVGWRAAAETLARDFYQALTRHPWLSAALGSYVVYGPNIARWMDHAGVVLESAGLRGLDVEWATNAILTYTLGTATAEATASAWYARMHREGTSEDEWREAAARTERINQPFPRLRARQELAHDRDPEELRIESFEFGLQAILDGVQARLPSE